MQEKIEQTEKSLETSWKITLSITLLALLHLSYIFYSKYTNLKAEYFEKTYNELSDDLLFGERFVDKDFIYDMKYAEHVNDNIDDRVEKIYIERKKEEINAGNNWIGESVSREDIREEIREKRAKYYADIEAVNAQQLLDLQWEKKYEKLNSATEKKVSEKNIFSYFSISYIIGAILGESIIPLIFWLIWRNLKLKLSNLYESDKCLKIELIKNHTQYANDFNLRLESLSDLEKSKILSSTQINKKQHNLIKEYYSKILDEQRLKQDKEKEIKLKTALELGNITQEEYDLKMGN